MQSFKEFCNEFNRSQWKGIITEVGIGLEFSSQYLRIPGASKTILAIDCPYGLPTPDGIRAVSLENAKRMAKDNLAKAIKQMPSYEYKNAFGLAITGAHYSNRAANVWVHLATHEHESWMHFSIPATARYGAGEWLSNHVMLFLKSCLLGEVWQDTIRRFNEEAEGLGPNVDVLYGPGLSDIERLLLLQPDNPLAYHKGQFRRVVDCLREYPTIYPGAFNPPTKKHLSVGSCLYEISQKHHYKGTISLEQLLHRTRMLDAARKPVLLTQSPRFIDKYEVLTEVCEVPELIFLVGADAWNATIIAHQYPNVNWLSEQMPNASFSIMERAGTTVDKNAISATLLWRMSDLPYHENTECNSTAIRESESPSVHEYLTPEVAHYISKHNLYLTTEQTKV